MMEEGSLLKNRYRIQEVLGRGGMGAVYRAIDESLNVPVAVKENFFTEEEDYIRQFRREATILANLRHPNLPRVTDHFVIEGQGQYLVMDYIDGEDLRHRVERLGALSGKEVLLLGIAITDALNYLHTLDPPVVHRDIKPGNIKVDPAGNVYLVDFGLVKVLRDSKETTTGARGLTPGYSPPEQYGGARTDARSDIYALGATLYSVLTGSPPEDSLARAMNQIQLTSIRTRNKKVSPEVAEVIEKALAVQPEDRFQTAARFHKALMDASETVSRKVASGDVTVTPPPDRTLDMPEKVAKTTEIPKSASAPTYQPAPAPTAYQQVSQPSYPPQQEQPLSQPQYPPAQPVYDTQPRRRSNLWVLGLMAIGIILSIAAAGFFIIPKLLDGNLPIVALDATNTPTYTLAPPTSTLAPTPDEAAAVSTATNTLEPTDANTTTAVPTDTPAATPQGGGLGRVAFASSAGGAKPQIWIMNVDGSELIQVTDEIAGACQPDWSPDGTQLVFISPCTRNTDSYPGAGLFIVNADGSGVVPLPSSPAGDYDPSWSPAGDLIAFTSLRDGRPQIYSIDVTTREANNLSNSNSYDFQPSWSLDGELLLFVTTRVGPTQIWYMGKGGNPDWGVVTRTDIQLGERYKNFDPVWSPDGETIIFTQEGYAVPRLRATYWDNGSSNRGWQEFNVTDNLAPMLEADFSADGNWIAFESYPQGDNHDIYIMTVAATSLQRLTTDPAYDFDAAWSP
jgi:serine/threonine protein kinase/Tol biopolymer transport system component